MGHIGRPRKVGVPRETRNCRHHGDTLFSFTGRSWRCMACSREDAALRGLLNGTRRAGEPEANDGTSNQPGARRGKVCPSCSMEMPLTGVCDNCD